MLNQAEYFVKRESIDVPEIQESIDAIINYITEGDYHESKEERLSKWQCYEGDLFELVISIFTITLQGQQTYQSCIGMLASKIPLEAKLDRIQTIAEVIAVVASTGLIRITKIGNGRSIIIDTEYTLEGIPTTCKHEILFDKPECVTSNYTDEAGSMFLGSGFNYHKNNICLDHLNRMNAVELQLNTPFLRATKEEPKKQLTDADGLYQWNQYVKESRSCYLSIGKRSFHLQHKYDARGRCYASGYYVNYQGSSFKKASIQLAKSEKLNEV